MRSNEVVQGGQAQSSSEQEDRVAEGTAQSKASLSSTSESAKDG